MPAPETVPAPETTLRSDAEPLWDLVEQSLEEAPFYWKRWEADLASPSRNLDAVVTWTEDRLHGALDGVRCAGDGIVRVCEPQLRSKSLLAVTVAAHLLAAGSPAGSRAALATAVGEATGPPLWAMIRGIELAKLDGSFAPVAAVLAARGPEHAAALCHLKAFRRAALGRELAQALEAGVPALQAVALQAAGNGADEASERLLAAALTRGEVEVRRAAMISGIRRRVPGAWEEAVELARSRDPESAPLLSLLAALGSPEEQRIVIAALRVPALQRAGLYALAYLGTPEAVEICLAGMRDPELARSAGEAYCAITGADLARDGLTAPEPDITTPPFEEDALDADLIPKPQDLWPLPQLEAVRHHWLRIEAGYSPGVRHLYGRPLDLDGLLRALETGPMLRRADLALEVGVRSGGQYDLETRAFAETQRGMMAAGRERSAGRPPR